MSFLVDRDLNQKVHLGALPWLQAALVWCHSQLRTSCRRAELSRKIFPNVILHNAGTAQAFLMSLGRIQGFQHRPALLNTAHGQCGKNGTLGSDLEEDLLIH